MTEHLKGKMALAEIPINFDDAHFGDKVPDIKYGLMDVDTAVRHSEANRYLPKQKINEKGKPRHHMNRAEYKRLSDNLLDLICRILEGCSQADPDVRQLLALINRLKKFPGPQPHNIAIVGPQGSGKSLFVCAFLGDASFAQSGASGKACTNVVCRYSHETRPSGQAFSVRAKITFKRVSDLQETIQLYTTWLVKHLDDDDDPDLSPAEMDELQKSRLSQETTNNATMARHFFESILGGKEEFLRRWSVPRGKNGSFSELVLRKCMQFVYEADSPLSKVIYLEDSSISGLLHKLRPYMVDIDGEPSWWPLVEVIDFYLDNCVLSQGIILWDFPGKLDHYG
jgi:hypothetical protein